MKLKICKIYVDSPGAESVRVKYQDEVTRAIQQKVCRLFSFLDLNPVWCLNDAIELYFNFLYFRLSLWRFNIEFFVSLIKQLSSNQYFYLTPTLYIHLVKKILRENCWVFGKPSSSCLIFPKANIINEAGWIPDISKQANNKCFSRLRCKEFKQEQKHRTLYVFY